MRSLDSAVGVIRGVCRSLDGSGVTKDEDNEEWGEEEKGVEEEEERSLEAKADESDVDIDECGERLKDVMRQS